MEGLESLAADRAFQGNVPAWARSIAVGGSRGVRFSICTLVTDRGQYAEMVTSFADHGFTPDECEFLFIDNSAGNVVDAFAGCNVLLSEASGDFIILCHQDIQLLDHDRRCLEARLAELNQIDPNWAVCGNAGGGGFGKIAVRISDPHGRDQSIGNFPTRVVALDENFLVIRRSANLALSHDLSGFHHYGADLCIIADVLGFSSWVIDFHLLHKSAGNPDAGYAELLGAVTRKWRRALRSRWVATPCASYFVSALPISNSVINRLVAKLLRMGDHPTDAPDRPPLRGRSHR